MCIKVCAECVFASKVVGVCGCGEGGRRGAGFSSCALSIIHDLTLGKKQRRARWTGVRGKRGRDSVSEFLPLSDGK